jgi:hypothetical protein
MIKRRRKMPDNNTSASAINKEVLLSRSSPEHARTSFDNTSASARSHRVGTITTGLCFIGFGVAFLLHTTLGMFSYENILSVWPLILISLGIEVLAASKFCKTFVYDKAGAFMMIMMGFFSMSMAFADICLKHAEVFW